MPGGAGFLPSTVLNPYFEGGYVRGGRLTSHDLLMEVELLLNFLSGKLTSQWKMDLLRMYSRLKMGICSSLPC